MAQKILKRLIYNKMEDENDPETYSFASQDSVRNSHLLRESSCTNSPESIFIQDRLSPVLQFPLRSIKLPTFYNEQIGLDYPSHPNDALYQLAYYKPFIIELPPSSNYSSSTSNSIRRKRQFIFGYREIFLKRQRICFLRQIAGLKPLNEDDNESSPFSKDLDRLSLFSVARGGADQNPNPNPNEGEDDTKKRKLKRTNSKVSRNSSKNKIPGNPAEIQQQQQQQQQPQQQVGNQNVRKDSQNSNPENKKQGRLKKWFKGLRAKKDGQGQGQDEEGQGKKGRRNLAVTVSKVIKEKEKEEGGKKTKRPKGPKVIDDDGSSVSSKGKRPKRPKKPKEPKDPHAVDETTDPNTTEAPLDSALEQTQNQTHPHSHQHTHSHHHHPHSEPPVPEQPVETEEEEKKDDEAIQGHELTVDDTAKTETTITINPTVIEVPEVEQKFMREKVPEIEEEEGALVVETAEGTGDNVLDLDNEDVFVPIPQNIAEAEEKEDEWLELSPTNSIEAIQRAEAKTLKKEYESWMQTKISFESQNFVGAMKCYLVSSKWTGRSPFYTKYDYNDYVIDFMVDRRKEFIYFTTSIILWLIFVLIVQAMIDVAFLSGDDEYTTKEKEEFYKYVIPSIFIIGQLAVTALWSVLVLLNYGLRMAHYANTWSVALTEMEINAAKGIANNTVMNHVFFFLYLIIIVVAFATETPKNVRGSMGILTILLVRNAIPRAAEDREDGSTVHILIYQIIGVILHLYIMYCSRIIYNQIQIFAIVLRNASEMWNLKFALRFGQIPTGTSGYLKHLKIRQTLVKIWLHHRLLTALCVQLGEIFVMPIMVIFISNLGVVVYALTKLFESAYTTAEKRETYIKTRERFKHSVNYLPTEIEDVSTMLFVLIYLILDFLVLAYFLASAGQAFRDGFEFVRRKGLILCNTSHERRLIQSLQWSFSATNATEVNLLGFFAVNWETMLSFLSIALLLWSLIIQLQQEAKGAIVILTPNCSQEPRTKRPSPDIEGFCRKKIWVPESELDARVRYITAKIKNTATDLELRDRRRRRRRRRSLRSTESQSQSIENQIFALSYEKSRRLMNGNVFKSHHHIPTEGNQTEGYYYGGNCLKPLTFISKPNINTNHHTHDQYNKFTWRSYYNHFHEKCFSPFLNETFVVPKLYGEEKRVWRGRSAVDCGIFPFPFPSYFGHDCSGEQTRIQIPVKEQSKQGQGQPELSTVLLDYDDCGWRKTKVDDIAFSSGNFNDNNNNNFTIGKVPIVFNNGQVIHCWNIFSALKRCHRIKELNMAEICPYSRNQSILDDPSQLVKSYSHLKVEEKTTQVEPTRTTMQMKTRNEKLLRRG